MRSRSLARLLWRPTVPKLFLLVAFGAALAAYVMYLTPEKRAVRTRLNEADTQSKAALDERVKPLAQLFARSRTGAGAFAKEAMSWRGKWALVRGAAVPGTHREFLSEAFTRHIFTPDELRDAIESVCRAYADDLDGVEGEMLVRLRMDLADPDRPLHKLPPHLRDDDAFQREYHALIARVAGDTQSDLAVTAGREVVVLVATELATRAAVQAARAAAVEMGVQGTVLGSGAVSGLATLGVGIVAGFIIDAVIEELFKLIGYDGESRVETAVRGAIDKLEAALIGDPGLARYLGGAKKGALRVEMEKLHEERSKLRRGAVELMLKEGGRK